MAKKRSNPRRPNTNAPAAGQTNKKGAAWSSSSGNVVANAINGTANAQPALPAKTGRFLVCMPGADQASLTQALDSIGASSGLKHKARSSDFAAAMDMQQADTADMIMFDQLGLAVLNPDNDQIGKVKEKAQEQGVLLEEERWNYALGLDDDYDAFGSRPVQAEFQLNSNSLDYVRGFRDGLSQVLEQLEARGGGIGVERLSFATDFSDTMVATWGLQATAVLSTMRGGQGIKVAVLDSGFDVTHPDADSTRMTSRSFIPSSVLGNNGQTIILNDLDAEIDISGHGTHCIGTACGPLTPTSGPRYGIAYQSQIFNGKVLSVIPGTGRAAGADAWIIAGIHWAIQSGCSIISMSLGSPVSRGEGYSPSYEQLADSAMRNGVLIVAAAGNESDRRNGVVNPVGSPANCPNIVSVAAVRRDLSTQGLHNIANFSNRHLNSHGGEVNFCAPGVDILSSYPSPRLHRLNGTSQATPHVAGVAALVQEETGKTGLELYRELRDRVKPQGHPVDFGNGLVQV